MVLRPNISPKKSLCICDRSVPLASNLAEGPEVPENGEQQSKRIEGAEIGVLPSLQSRGLGAAPKSSWILRRHSAPHQSGRGDYYTKRTGHPTSEPLLGKRAVEEYRHADRAVAEERYLARPALQPWVGRSQPDKRGRTRRAASSTRRVTAATGSSGTSGIRKPELQRDWPKAAANHWSARAALHERRIWISGRSREPNAVALQRGASKSVPGSKAR